MTTHTPPPVLLALRACEPFKGLRCLPGGHIEDNQPVRDAVIREVKEETGLDFEPRLLAYFDEIHPERRVHHVVLAFHGTAQGTLAIQPEEVADARWFAFDDALGMELAFDHGAVLRAYR